MYLPPSVSPSLSFTTTTTTALRRPLRSSISKVLSSPTRSAVVVQRFSLAGTQLRGVADGHGKTGEGGVGVGAAASNRPICSRAFSYISRSTSSSSSLCRKSYSSAFVRQIVWTRNICTHSWKPLLSVTHCFEPGSLNTNSGSSTCISTTKRQASTTSSTTDTTTMSDSQITTLKKSDYVEWEKLFRAYIDFYKSSIPEEQYGKTFARLLDPSSDLYGLVLRDESDENKLIGIAHFFPHQTPWSERKIMHFNDLFIDPNVRSKGYGRRMILAVSEEAKKHGCFRLEWATQHGNTTARKLYDQLAACDFVEYRIKLD